MNASAFILSMNESVFSSCYFDFIVALVTLNKGIMVSHLQCERSKEKGIKHLNELKCSVND